MQSKCLAIISKCKFQTSDGPQGTLQVPQEQLHTDWNIKYPKELTLKITIIIIFIIIIIIFLRILKDMIFTENFERRMFHGLHTIKSRLKVFVLCTNTSFFNFK